ncbi:tripartite tricarboxylate transporter substrate binding protein BugD [Methylobacterium sp.]|uniref:tripartite tricarboxylate transporter substrate binding protein BugD n=1 Tax=Methylobacterium sp. TaxID=409 RepID=UPI003C77CDC3
MPRILPIFAALLMTTAAGAAFAQSDYPNRPITIIVPHAAGGPTDTVSRLIAESMTRSLGETLVVENAGGAGSTVGAARAARAEPDGYTLMINHVAQASSGSLYRKLAFDPDADFDGVGLITDVPMTVVARKDFEPTDIASYIAWVKEHGDEVLYGHAGVGSASHLCGMLLMDALDVKMTTVPYKGTGPAMTDLLGGQIDTMCDQTTNTIPQMTSGAIKGYAVTTPERIEVLPDLPTLQEAGLEGFEMTVWHGMFAPAGTPPEILEKLSGALQVALQDPKVIERFAQLGTTPVPVEEATPAALDAHLAAEIAKWKSVVAKAGEFAD